MIIDVQMKARIGDRHMFTCMLVDDNHIQCGICTAKIPAELDRECWRCGARIVLMRFQEIDDNHKVIKEIRSKMMNEPMLEKETTANKMPEGQGKRDVKRPRHDLIPVEFLDALAAIFEEGRRPRPGMPDGYGDSWKAGGPDFLLDCLNHASNHLHKYMNGDRTEDHMPKVAWNCLVIDYFNRRKE